jgi:septum formation inhibitor MinC
MMSEKRMWLAQRLAEVEQELAETVKRLPAHSVKPPIMITLFALEDEKAELQQQLARLETAG